MKPRIPLPGPLQVRAFTRAEGKAAGLSTKRLRGDLAQPFHGVRVAGSLPIDLLPRCRALVPVLPAGAFFCSITAAAIMGLPMPFAFTQTPAKPLHVAVPSPGRAPERRGVIGHKVLVTAADVRDWDSIRLSTPERTWCELGALLRLEDLVAVGDYLTHWRSPFTTLARLAEAVARYPNGRGKPKLLAAIALIDERSESPKESVLRVILVRAGLTGLVTNHPVTLFSKRYRADLAFPAEKVTLEYQGAHHSDVTQWRQDMTRRGHFEADGWFVMEFNNNDLDHPAELVARVRAVLAQRGRKP